MNTRNDLQRVAGSPAWISTEGKFSCEFKPSRRIAVESGDKCPQCGGTLNVTHTLIIKQTRKRYLGCRKCKFRPEENVKTVSLSSAPRQPLRHWQKRILATVAMKQMAMPS